MIPEWITTLGLRIKALLRRRKLDRDLREELRFHLVMRQEKYLAAGMASQDAEAAALRRFGNSTGFKEACREMWTFTWLETSAQDMRYGLRQLRRNPGFTAVAVITLALGIGANTAVFGLINALFLRLLPVPGAVQLANVYQTRNGDGYYDLSYPDFIFYRNHSHSFSSLAAQYATAPLDLTVSGEPENINGSIVSANYFHLLDLEPFLGRFFFPREDVVPGRDPVAVISYTFWKRRFGSDPKIPGKTVQLNGTPFTIVGVAPQYFRGATPGVAATDVWIPTAMFRVGYRYCDAFRRDCTILTLIGRLEPERTVADAQAELNVLARQLQAAYPKVDRGLGVVVTAARGESPDERSEGRSVAILLFVAVGLVLLVACANVAGLLLVRGTARRKEIAVRLALGAGRTRIVRQLLTEGLILALFGGVLGVLVGDWAIKLLSTFYATEGGGIYLNLALDPTVLLFTLALSVVTGVIFALAPALQASRPNVVVSLKEEVSSASPRRSILRDSLAIAQVAVSVLLLVGVGLLVASVRNIYRGPGFDPSHLASLRLRPSLIGYGTAKARLFQQRVIRSLNALPGVVSASPAEYPPLPWGGEASVWLSTQQSEQPKLAFIVGANKVGPRYFETLGVPLLQGREFDEDDRPGAPAVAVVNETLARHFWPHASPVGKTIMADGRAYDIVGVVPDAQYHTSLQPPPPFLYTDYWQHDTTDSWSEDSRTLVRVVGSAGAMLPVLRKKIAGVDPNVPISEDRSLAEWLGSKFQSVRMATNFFICFGGLGLFLSAIGLYGILAFTVSQRTRDIGIRMALGAERSDVAGIVVRQGVRLALTGAGIGLSGAFASVRFLESFLYGVHAYDPVAFLLAPGVLIGAALLASYIPARRATKVDPMVALRHE